jgi:hypothetical protein
MISSSVIFTITYANEFLVCLGKSRTDISVLIAYEKAPFFIRCGTPAGYSNLRMRNF